MDRSRRIETLTLVLAVGTAALAMPPRGVSAQEFEDVVGRYTGVNSEGFLQPLADAFGANLNRGLFQSARIEPGFHLRFTLVSQNALIPDDARTFEAVTGEGFVPEQTAEASTIFGPIESTTVTGTGGTAYRFPGGLDLGILSTAVPQLTVGSVAGTDATLRWLAFDFGEDFGKLNLWGFGLRHSVSQYLDDLPVDLAVGLYTHTLDFADIVEASSFLLSLQGSIERSVVTGYAGLGYETASVDVSYESESAEGGTVDISLDAANTVVATAGVSFDLRVLHLWTDYTLGAQNVWAFGVGFGN